MLAFVLFQKRRFQHLRFRNRVCCHESKLIVGAVPDKGEDAYVGPLGRTGTEILPNTVFDTLRVGCRTEVENVGAANPPCELSTATGRVHARFYGQGSDQCRLASLTERRPDTESVRGEVRAFHRAQDTT